MESTDANQPGQTGQIQTWIKSDQYVASSLPGSEEVREFQQAMAKELDWVPGEIFGANPQVSSGMAELRKNAAVQGFPMLQYISMGLGAPGQPAAANTNAQSSQPPAQQASGPPDISSPSAAAAQTLGKVFGGFHHHMDMVGSLGLPRWLAYFSTATEFFGGIAIVLGLFTRFFSTAFVIEMAVAIWKVHFRHGLTGQGGYEFPLAAATIAFALLCFGGGPLGFNFGRGSSGWGKSKS
jgi:putative oxidoreductase